MVIKRTAKRKQLTPSIAMAFALPPGIVRADFPSETALSGLTGSSGSVTNGVSSGNHPGAPVSAASFVKVSFPLKNRSQCIR